MTGLSKVKGELESKENIRDNENSSTETRPLILLGTQFQIQISTGVRPDSTKFQSELVGIEYDNYLIIKLENFFLNQNFQNIFYKGASLTMRGLFEGKVIGFRTSVLKVIYNPTLIFIEYPKSIEYQQIRSYRVKCFLPAKISIDGNDHEGYIVNISKSGCRYILSISSNKVNSQSHVINKEIFISLQLPGVEGYRSVSGKLKQFEKNRDRIDYGIEFNAIEDRTKSELFRYLSDAEALMKYL